MRRSTILGLSCCLLLLAAAVAPAAASSQASVRVVEPTYVVMTFPGGDLERPAIEFNHAAHVAALEADGCVTCHAVDGADFDPTLKAVAGIVALDALTDAYHDTCIGCHQRMTGEGAVSGPVTCGECHVRRSPGVSGRAQVVLDRSLHARHAQAYPDDCAKCHHVLDEATGTLVHRENSEERCAGCHAEPSRDSQPVLRTAVHRTCVGCHLERTERAEQSGPVQCAGCHDAAVIAGIEPLAEIPRLMRGQPNSLWVKAPGSSSPMVVFNHQNHELQADTCSGCHHNRMKACSDCHGDTAMVDGGGVILERAHHDRTAEMSCVGCHRTAAAEGDCAGCHVDTTVASNPETGCVVCHNGPRPQPDVSPEPPADGSPVVAALEVLPEASDDLPDEVTIDLLVDAYEASTFPHLKIVRRFDEGIRASSLAKQFHGSTEAMCAGCHHHSPAGERPPKCSACHGDEDAATVDKPSLKVAYHRQCVTCHQRLKIKAGCTDCHAAREGQS